MVSNDEPIMDKTLQPSDELRISIRPKKCLNSINVNYVSDLIKKTEQDLLAIRNFGRTSLKEVKEALKGIGLALKSSSSDYHKSPLTDRVGDPNKYFLSESAGFDKKTFLYLLRNIEELDLSIRARNCLKSKGIKLIGELVQKKPSELLQTINFGKKSLAEIRSKLNKVKLDIGMEIIGWNEENVKKALRDYSLELNRLRQSEAKERFFKKSEGLEADLARLAVLAGKERDRDIVIKYLGWDGKGGRTLEILGTEFGMTRERVRQVVAKFEKKVLEAKRLRGIYFPKIYLALNRVAEQIPKEVADIEMDLVGQGISKGTFRLEGLLSAASLLGCKAGFVLRSYRNRRFALSLGTGNFLNHIMFISRKAVARRGVSTILDIAAQVGEKVGQQIPEEIVVSVLSTQKDFKWLDKSRGWFFLSSVPRNRLLNLMEKILSVCSQIDIQDLRSGISRNHRMEGFAPPKEVLFQFCREIPWCKIQGESICSDPPLDWEQILKGTTDWAMCAILKEYGPVMSRAEFERRCLELGMNQQTFHQYLSYSPIITKIAIGIYALRGSKISPLVVEALRSVHTTRKGVSDYGWTDDGKIWIALEISEAMLLTGVFGIPAAMKEFIQGNFALKTADGASIGSIRLKESSGWNLRHFFKRRGGEPGDYLVLVFNFKDRVVNIHVGDAGIMDDFVA
jgi:hypothetical protein